MEPYKAFDAYFLHACGIRYCEIPDPPPQRIKPVLVFNAVDYENGESLMDFIRRNGLL